MPECYLVRMLNENVIICIIFNIFYAALVQRAWNERAVIRMICLLMWWKNFDEACHGILHQNLSKEFDFELGLSNITQSSH